MSKLIYFRLWPGPNNSRYNYPKELLTTIFGSEEEALQAAETYLTSFSEATNKDRPSLPDIGSGYSYGVRVRGKVTLEIRQVQRALTTSLTHFNSNRPEPDLSLKLYQVNCVVPFEWRALDSYQAIERKVIDGETYEKKVPKTEVLINWQRPYVPQYSARQESNLGLELALEVRRVELTWAGAAAQVRTPSEPKGADPAINDRFQLIEVD